MFINNKLAKPKNTISAEKKNVRRKNAEISHAQHKEKAQFMVFHSNDGYMYSDNGNYNTLEYHRFE